MHYTQRQKVQLGVFDFLQDFRNRSASDDFLALLILRVNREGQGTAQSRNEHLELNHFDQFFQTPFLSLSDDVFQFNSRFLSLQQKSLYFHRYSEPLSSLVVVSPVELLLNGLWSGKEREVSASGDLVGAH